MAQAIHCDGEGHLEVLADIIVSNTANGDTSAWCYEHYVDMSRALVATYDQAVAEAEAQAEADQAAAEAQARLEGTSPPPGDQLDPDQDSPAQAAQRAADLESLADLGLEPPATAPPAEGDMDAAGGAPSQASPAAPPDLGVGTFRETGDQPLQDGLGGPETGAAGETGPEPTAVENGPPGPSSDGTEDASAPTGEPVETSARA